MEVKYAYLSREYFYFKEDIDDAIVRCLSEASFILRNDVTQFESRIGALHGGAYCIGLNSGTDALNIMLKLAKIPSGSEIIVSAHTFVSTISAVVNSGNIPVFCDIDTNGNTDINRLKLLINKRTKGILVTHMNGLMNDMGAITSLAKENELVVFEDAAQAIGSTENGRPPGLLSNGAAFSLHPLKTLSVAGDGGFIVTNDEEFAIKAKAYRNLGQLTKGFYEINGCNSRLDNIQAAIANVKLYQLQLLIDKRKSHAAEYISTMKDIAYIKLPDVTNQIFNHTYSNFVIRVRDRDRDNIADFLRKNGIETMVHWKPAVFELELFQSYINTGTQFTVARDYINTCLSLPISPWMYEEERDYVVSKIKEFYGA